MRTAALRTPDRARRLPSLPYGGRQDLSSVAELCMSTVTRANVGKDATLFRAAVEAIVVIHQ